MWYTHKIELLRLKKEGNLVTYHNIDELEGHYAI